MHRNLRKWSKTEWFREKHFTMVRSVRFNRQETSRKRGKLNKIGKCVQQENVKYLFLCPEVKAIVWAMPNLFLSSKEPEPCCSLLPLPLLPWLMLVSFPPEGGKGGIVNDDDINEDATGRFAVWYCESVDEAIAFEVVAKVSVDGSSATSPYESLQLNCRLD